VMVGDGNCLARTRRNASHRWRQRHPQLLPGDQQCILAGQGGAHRSYRDCGAAPRGLPGFFERASRTPASVTFTWNAVPNATGFHAPAAPPAQDSRGRRFAKRRPPPRRTSTPTRSITRRRTSIACTPTTRTLAGVRGRGRVASAAIGFRQTSRPSSCHLTCT
jgi:hypothetical protein